MIAELWDVYDENRNKTGRTHERGKPLPKGDYHIVVSVWIINCKKEVLLTKRHQSKHWGNYWECTGGSVTAGENSLQGALREVSEEIGIHLNGEEGKLLYEERRESDFIDTWIFNKDLSLTDLVLQAEEVVDAKWVNNDEYEDMMNKGLIVPTLKNIFDLL